MKLQVKKCLAISGKITYMITILNQGIMVFNEEVKTWDDINPIAKFYNLELPERI